MSQSKIERFSLQLTSLEAFSFCQHLATKTRVSSRALSSRFSKGSFQEDDIKTLIKFLSDRKLNLISNLTTDDHLKSFPSTQERMQE
jgi:hypothetical protein